MESKHRNFSELLSKQARSASVETWARRLGYTQPTTVLSWLEGRRLPDIAKAETLGDVFDLDPMHIAMVWLMDAAPFLAPECQDIIRTRDLEGRSRKHLIWMPPRSDGEA